MKCFDGNEGSAKQQSILLDKQLREFGIKAINEREVLLLGTEGSGKSTFLKQMKIIHNTGYSEEIRKSYKVPILNFAIRSLTNILKAMDSLSSPVEFECPERKADVEKFMIFKLLDSTDNQLPEGASEVMKTLWEDGGVQACFKHSSEFQITGSEQYYLDDLDRICDSDFIPSQHDVMRFREQNTALVDENVVYNDLHYHFFDVGDQKLVRSKHVHHFDGVSAIVFCVSLSDYDTVLANDATKNKMHQSMELFDYICNNKYFKNTAIFLLLNKKDLFEEKIKKSSLKKCFPEYTGADEYNEASQFIQGKFEALANEDKEIYSHFTCATDTGDIRIAFNVLMDVIIDSFIKQVLKENDIDK